ncbi:MAG: GNAT family N-acetyltransferase [Butyrivibrio sp.]|nr:GNAT family N-acetyltransferase [Butyrivibrio sp.]
MSSFRRVKKDATDIEVVVNIYNSNREFLIHHLGKEKVSEGFISCEMQEMEEHGFCSDLIIEDGRGIGIVDYMLQDDGYVYLSMLMLDSSVQKFGKGTAVYKLFEEKMISAGALKIRIDVVDDYEPNVIPFWEKQGFVAKRSDALTWGDKTSSVVVMEKEVGRKEFPLDKLRA